MKVSIRGSCKGCKFHSLHITPTSGTYVHHYCSNPCIVSVTPDRHFPNVDISYDSANDKGMRMYLGENDKTPRWCPFVDRSLWEEIESKVPVLTGRQIDSTQSPTDPDLRWHCDTCEKQTVRHNGRIFICDNCP